MTTSHPRLYFQISLFYSQSRVSETRHQRCRRGLYASAVSRQVSSQGFLLSASHQFCFTPALPNSAIVQRAQSQHCPVRNCAFRADLLVTSFAFFSQRSSYLKNGRPAVLCIISFSIYSSTLQLDRPKPLSPASQSLEQPPGQDVSWQRHPSSHTRRPHFR